MKYIILLKNLLKKENTILGIIICIAFIFRIYFIIRADFPLNDGGMFYTMIKDIIHNNFLLPSYTTYNQANVPFGYSPLAFYVSAVLFKFLHIPLIEIFRFLPFIMSILSIPLFYVLTKVILKSKNAALLSTFVFAITPRTFETLIEGGGLTRSFGFFFALLSIYVFYKMYTTDKKKYIVFAGIVFGLCVLSHIENALFAGISIVVLYAVYSRTLKSFLYSLLALGLALVLSSPWWVTVIYYHGISPFISASQANMSTASQTNQWDAFTIQQFYFLWGYIGGPRIDFTSFLIILGLVVSILKRSYYIPLWILVVFLFATRMLHTAAYVPLCMLVGVGVYEVIIPGMMYFMRRSYKPFKLPFFTIFEHNLGRELFVLALVCVLCIVSFISSFGQQLSTVDYLKKDQRVAMEWIRNNTEKSDTFLVVSPLPQWLWFIDQTLEWFPALTERQSLTTVQSYEWLPNFRNRLHLNQEFKECNDKDISCVESFAQKNSLQYTYIYIPKDLRLDVSFSPCCSLLVYSLMSSGKYKVVYNGKGATVWKRIAQE